VALGIVAAPVILEAAAGAIGEYITVRTRGQRDVGVQAIHLGAQEIQTGAGIVKGPDLRLRHAGGEPDVAIEAPETLLHTEDTVDHA
jgi:hypothetical protein